MIDACSDFKQYWSQLLNVGSTLLIIYGFFHSSSNLCSLSPSRPTAPWTRLSLATDWESWHTGVKIMTLCKHRLVSPGRRSREPRSCWKLSPPLHPETTNGCQPYWQEVWDEKYEQCVWGEEKYEQRAWKKKWHLEQIAALLQVHRQCWEAALTSTNNRWQN